MFLRSPDHPRTGGRGGEEGTGPPVTSRGRRKYTGFRRGRSKDAGAAPAAVKTQTLRSRRGFSTSEGSAAPQALRRSSPGGRSFFPAAAGLLHDLLEPPFDLRSGSEAIDRRHELLELRDAIGGRGMRVEDRGTRS